ncbi:actin [Histomonas meleagridis]|uniref:actin n=1 Tax=Histomonas meleagridis TaxID=135588 RepID=UPI00355A7B57|nr:actin [Histomonas meleagridis]KAH0799445.1 actin [Histomonas meleagridis]
MDVPIVIDNGIGFTKAGFANKEAPKTIFPSVVGIPKSTQQMIGGQNKDFFVGTEALNKSDLLNLCHPVENESVINWDDMVKLWHHCFYDELITDPEEHSVILSEKPLSPRTNREKMIQIMFETFNVRGFYVGVQAVFTLFSLGKTTGIVWDAGEGYSYSVPIYESFPLPHAILHNSISGFDLTNLLRQMLINNGCDESILKPSAIRSMKEHICSVSYDFQTDIQKAEKVKSPRESYRLPDGTVTYGTEAIRCPEALFTPSIANSQSNGVHQMIHTSLDRCDMDVRKEMYSNIVLSGGTSMFKGLPERMEKEIIALATPSMKVRVFATPERKNSVWIGGSVFGSMDAFPQLMISKAEYEEEGTQIVHIKYFN